MMGGDSAMAGDDDDNDRRDTLFDAAVVGGGPAGLMLSHLLQRETQQVRGLRAQVSALGPSATLARGYAVVQVLPRDGSDAEVVTSIDQSPPGSQLRIRVGDGSISAASMSTTQAD